MQNFGTISPKLCHLQPKTTGTWGVNTTIVCNKSQEICQQQLVHDYRINIELKMKIVSLHNLEFSHFDFFTFVLMQLPGCTKAKVLS